MPFAAFLNGMAVSSAHHARCSGARTDEACESVYRCETLIARRDQAVSLDFEMGQEATHDFGREAFELQPIDCLASLLGRKRE